MSVEGQIRFSLLHNWKLLALTHSHYNSSISLVASKFLLKEVRTHSSSRCDHCYFVTTRPECRFMTLVHVRKDGRKKLNIRPQNSYVISSIFLVSPFHFFIFNYRLFYYRFSIIISYYNSDLLNVFSVCGF